jgi:DNA-binding transcriptional MerR regulator
VTVPAQFLSPSQAAQHLGVSAKALRLYEARGLVRPIRAQAGWRAYGPGEMRRAAEVAALRGLGFSLTQVERVLGADAQGLKPSLAAHQARLEGQMQTLAAIAERVRCLRQGLAEGRAPAIGDLVRLVKAQGPPAVAFDLSWPWGGERFELREVRALNHIVGPLGSGKTRLAQRLAEALPGAAFVGLDRMADNSRSALARLDADIALDLRVTAVCNWLVEDGATGSDALTALLVALEDEGPAALVIDVIEQNLDEATQVALIAHLQRSSRAERPLFLLTRSCAILDLGAVGADEAIILCPANHSSPSLVAPYLGAPGYEAVATCLAAPEVRARAEGIIAWHPDKASRRASA